MTTTLRLSTALTFALALGGCVAELGDDEAEAGISQDELTCSGSCCGSRYNCRVPDRELRRGCSGARIRNPATGDCMWPLAGDAERSVYDGLGNRVGEVRSAEVRLNQGIRKQRDGRWFVYAFNTTVRMSTGELRPFSGWIRQSDLVHTAHLHGYTLALRDPGHGYYETRWQITGDGREAYEGYYLHAIDGTRYPATDYLLRPYGLVHLTFTVPGFNLGGHATDSFPPGAIFRRARGVDQIEIPLYGPAGHRSSRYSLRFVYGYVHDGESRRYGWIAKEALRALPRDPAPAPTSGHTCSARCCDGTVVTDLSADSGGACVSAASPVCADHEYVLRARFDGEVRYERDRFCWAKCANRSAYHRLDGIDVDCTYAAELFCRVGDRGAFEDAIWDPCQPR